MTDIYSNLLEDAKKYWSNVYWPDPARQHTEEVLRARVLPERLKAECHATLADRVRICLETAVPHAYYFEVDNLHWPGKLVLDFGCGVGIDALLLAERGARVTLVDIIPSNIEVASRTLDGYQHHCFPIGSPSDLDALGLFDIIFSHGVLHHIHPPLDVAMVDHLLSRLIPGGILLAMIYTNFYYPDPSTTQEGPYTRGFSPSQIVEFLGPRMEVLSYRYVLGRTCAWIIARRKP